MRFLARVVAVGALASAVCEARVKTVDVTKAGRPVVDAHGLAFVDTESFCRFHCAKMHFARVYRPLEHTSQCTTSMCGEWQRPRRRRLDGRQETNETNRPEEPKIDVLSCKFPQASTAILTLELNRSDASPASVFRDLHSAVFAAFDAMLVGANASYDACHLDLLQDKLLPYWGAQGVQRDAARRNPMLVKLRNTGDGGGDEESSQLNDRACIVAVRSVWNSDKEAITSLMTRRGQHETSSTHLLVQANVSMAERIRALNCVHSVQDVPVILKLMPLARSAAQLGLRMEERASRNDSRAPVAAPALEIRLLDESSREGVHKRLQRRVEELLGLLNVFEMDASHSHSLFTRSLQDLEAWATIVALALSDADIQWLDERPQLVQSSSYQREEVSRLLHSAPKAQSNVRRAQRRLDEYAASLVGAEAAHAAGIRGTGVVVGLTDSGLDLYHDQFYQMGTAIFSATDPSARKVVRYDAVADSVENKECGHGTHIAGVLAGSSFSGTHGDLGIAPAARLAFQDIGEPDEACAGQEDCSVVLNMPGSNLAAHLWKQRSAGASIFSWSWGTTESDYDQLAHNLDAYVHEHPEVLFVVAAGNEGMRTRGQIASPAGAKNVVAVGASVNAAASFRPNCPGLDEFSVAPFSSRGPTTDGRLKPDVVAPGMPMVSSKSQASGSTVRTADTCSLQGTSMATPVVAGVAALLLEWLRDGWWKDDTKNATYRMSGVPAALLKALLIHSGDSMRRGFESCALDATRVNYPDVNQGYGKPNLSNLRRVLGAEEGSGTVSSGNTLVFLPNSTAGSEPTVGHGGQVIFPLVAHRGWNLRVTVVWTDPPGPVQASTQLQHDLDLCVRVAKGTKCFGPATATSATGLDDRNTVEMVQVHFDDLLWSAGRNSSEVGEEDTVAVEAVVYGRSVLLADAQAFAFASSSSPPTSTAFPLLTADPQPLSIGSGLLALAFVVVATLIMYQWCKRGRWCRHHRRTLVVVGTEYTTAIQRIRGHKKKAFYPRKAKAATCIPVKPQPTPASLD